LGDGAAKKKKKAKKTEDKKNGDTLKAIDEEKVAVIAAEASGTKSLDEAADEKKPLFQFTGDENFDDSDEEEEVRDFASLPYHTLVFAAVD
jgi:hypothetical protein